MPLIGCTGTWLGKINMDGRETVIATSIFDHDSEALMEAFKSGRRKKEQLYELRYDLFRKKDEKELSSIVDFLNSMEVDYIFTYRSTDVEDLVRFYGLASDMGTPAADIEVSVLGDLNADLKFRTLVLSHHSYSGEKIQQSCREILSLSPDIVKLASSYSRYEDFQDDFIVLQKIKKETGKCMSFIPMGSGNSFLRIVSAYVISDLAYAKEDSQTAEGQLTRSDYETFFRLF